MDNNIALVTPVKNEIDNLQKLIESIQNQSHGIYLWVIVQNDSDDGSKEYLNGINDIENVEHLVVLNLEHESKEYQLGKKYSSIMKQGFDYIRDSRFFTDVDFIGILDADCFPEAKYYETIVSEFHETEDAGIIGGIEKVNGETYKPFSKYDPVGNAMVFKKQCLIDSKYKSVPLSASYVKTKARTLNYNVIETDKTWYNARKMGLRVDYSYYGYGAYYLGIPLYHAILHSLKTLLTGRFRKSLSYLRGYLKSYISNKERIDDQDVISFNKYRIFNKYKGYNN